MKTLSCTIFGAALALSSGTAWAAAEHASGAESRTRRPLSAPLAHRTCGVGRLRSLQYAALLEAVLDSVDVRLRVAEHPRSPDDGPSAVGEGRVRREDQKICLEDELVGLYRA